MLLSESEIDAALAELNGWGVARNGASIYKEYLFADFAAAFAFITQCAIYAEKTDHHPEWENIYNKLRVHLTTHDAGGITDKDFALAKYMDAIFADKKTDKKIAQ